MGTTLPADPAGPLERLERWGVELRERGLGDKAHLDRLQAMLAQAYGERLDAPADPLLVVMLCGPTAVGKSSLINAIASAEISCPGLGATTNAAIVRPMTTNGFPPAFISESRSLSFNLRTRSS